MKYLLLGILCLGLLSFEALAEEQFFQTNLECLYGGECNNQASQEFNIDDYMDSSPYSYNGYLKSLYACQKTLKGCSPEEQAKIDEHEIGLRGFTAQQFSEFLKSHPGEYGKGYFIPLALTEKELLMFAAGTSLGLVIFHYDQEIMDFIQDHKTETTAKVTAVGNLFGSSLIPPVALGSYFLGAVFKNGQLKQVGLFTVTAGLATQLVTEGFKKTFNRVRPNGEQGPYAFGQDGNNSFFSGHTSGAFSFATVIAEVYKDVKWVPYVAYGLATVTAYARMHDQKHWATDVLAGAIMGHLITKAVIRLVQKDDSAGGLMVYPSYDASTGAYFINIEYTGKHKEPEFRCKQLPEGEERIRACIQEAFERSEAKKLF